MFFILLHEGPTSLAYICLGALGTGDEIDYTRSLLRGLEFFTCTKALHRVWAGLKLVLTLSGARIR